LNSQDLITATVGFDVRDDPEGIVVDSLNPSVSHDDIAEPEKRMKIAPAEAASSSYRLGRLPAPQGPRPALPRTAAAEG
jgi:hypothetical protein